VLVLTALVLHKGGETALSPQVKPTGKVHKLAPKIQTDYPVYPNPPAPKIDD
jgi:hypothetical protein